MDLDLGRRSIADWAERAPEKDATDFVPAKDKFVVETSIGRGGMGDVFLVTDQDLRRQVAMKVLRPDTGVGREPRLHFVAEAQATSQLEHPGIPPVHDIGLTKDGRPYFTMKLVRGRTLREVLHDLVLKRREVQKEFSLHRLVTVLERLAETLHFAHERGVMHRDIKPENVMLGDYGEVHLMDWGLARVGAESADFEQVETARTEAGLETQLGAVKGTLPYMSPEQALGDPIDGRADVYALGCLLYEVLTLKPAFDALDKELFTKVQMGSYADVAGRDARRPVPEPLADICRKAMARERDVRYATAAGMRDALRAWLDGRAERERRHEEAEKLAGQGREAAVKYDRLIAEAADADRAARTEAERFESWQPVAEKRPALEARARAEALRTEVALAFAETTHLLNAALTQEAENTTARGALAELWRSRLDDAERRGDGADTAHALAMADRYDDGKLAGFLEGDGALELASDPPGAEVLLYRYVERDGVLTPEDERRLGPTPVGPVTLPMGSYVCIVGKEGFRDTRYPVHITRNREWRGQVRLRTDEEIGAGLVYVPAGPFVYGEGKETRILELPDFAIARYPVTFAEYAVFLDGLDDEEAREHVPRTQIDGAYMERSADGQWGPKADLLAPDAHRLYRERFGEDFAWKFPVFGVSWPDAKAYCDWKGWRLPSEEEREKATRGVDGRRFAWGDLEDASLGKCRGSRPETPQPEPVGTFATAESVYGMGDASGGVWDWTDSWFDDRGALRVFRGGSWNLVPGVMRAANREGDDPANRNTFSGFRCARGFTSA